MNTAYESKFVGRNAELETLDDLWNRSQAALLILYGRRRVGKTSLLIRWMEQTGHRILYWVAVPTTPQEQLRSFSQALYRFTHSNDPAPPNYTLETWEYAWKEVANIARNERLAVFIDEFTYILASDSSVAGVLQNAWDHDLKKTNLFLVLSGSHLGMMKRQVLASDAPLYGRATAQIHLRPLSFGCTQSYFPDYAPADRVAIYAIWGGIPAYWELIDPSENVSENIRRLLLTPNNFLQDEPRLLLHDFVREPHNYIAIIQAIAYGSRTQGDIVKSTGLQQGHVSKYLSVLQKSGFVKRHVPVTKGPQSRTGRYYVSDPYLRFYYRFLAGRQEQLAMHAQQRALDEIRRHLLDFIGTHTWEEICREWLVLAGDRGDLPLLPDKVGSVWTPKMQIDVVGVNSMKKSLILGECKWNRGLSGPDVLTKLTDGTSVVVPSNGKWTVYYLGFARGGWTKAAQEYAEMISTSTLSGTNWTSAGMKLLDLDRIDRDLLSWIT